MENLIVIPARYMSSRFPAKPLVELSGSTGKCKPLIERTWRLAKKVKGENRIIVATDSRKIKSVAEKFGAEVLLTSSECVNGTERVAEVLDKLNREYSVIINLQGDAPLTPVWFIDTLVKAMENIEDDIATPVIRCDLEAYNNFLEDRKKGLVGGTTVVFDTFMKALYFSKEVLPYVSDIKIYKAVSPVFHHVGIYAYRSSALRSYRELGPSILERREGLEQLRFLENGIPIKCIEVRAEGVEFWELNNPGDVERIESIMKRQNMV